MSDTLADLLAKRFIARRDVKAIQRVLSDGTIIYQPHQTDSKDDTTRLPWKKSDLQAHIDGKATYGHYLLNTDSTCKLFAFDIDLEKTGWLPDGSGSTEEPWSNFVPVDDLRAAWLQRNHVGRPFMKYQFKMVASRLMQIIHKELELPTACAYSGGKGVHVYAFTGPIPASEAREGAQIVLDIFGQVEPSRGEHFFKFKDRDPALGFSNLSIEVFPKQTSLDGKDLGNLMRLPLGRNLKSKDPTFFIDMTTPMGVMTPANSFDALTKTNPWSD